MPVRPFAPHCRELPGGFGAFVAILASAALLAGIVPNTVSAQSNDLPGVDDDAYESPTYGYSLDWDGRDWEVVGATSDDGSDTLVLTNDVSTLYITGVGAYDGDAQECAIGMGEIVADPDAIDTYPSESGDSDLDPGDYSFLVDCRELVEDEAVLIIVHVFPADELGEELVEAQVVTDTITFAGDEGGSGNSGARDFEAAGVDGNAYESPGWGYTLEWDDGEWEVREASAGRASNVIRLINDDSSLIIAAFANLSDVDSCLERAVEFYSTDDDVGEWDVLEDEDGDPIERGTSRRAYGAYEHTITDDSGEELEFVNYIECLPLDDEAGIFISHLTPADTYDEQAELRDDILDTLEIP